MKLLELLKKLLKNVNPIELIKGAAKKPIIKMIQEHGDELQKQLVKAVEQNGPKIINKIVDETQKVLIEKIEKL